MTPAEIRIALALGTCSFLPASWDKRFCRDMAAIAANKPEHELSEYQNANLLRMAYKYRRQIPTTIIELTLDEMERQAERRTVEGRGALPLFSRPRPARAPRAQPVPPDLPLFSVKD